MAELRPGTTEKHLTAVLLEAMTAGGFSTPAIQDAVWVTSTEHPWRRVSGDRPIERGDLVTFAAGALARGYIGEVGRTWPAGDGDGVGVRRLYERADALWERLAGACRPGAHAGDLLAAYESAGEPLPPMPVAHGLGVGFDSPVVSPRLPATAADEQLRPGMVLAVSGYVWQQGVGAVLIREAVLVTADGHQVLTSSPHRNRLKE